MSSVPSSHSYLSSLDSFSEPDSGNESQEEDYKSLVQWSRLPSHHAQRLPKSNKYKFIKSKLPLLVSQVEQLINYTVPDNLFLVGQLFYQSKYKRAQSKLLQVLRWLAKCRIILRVVSRLARVGTFSEHLREVLSLQPLYRLNHTCAYAYSQLLRVKLLPLLESYYSVGAIISLPNPHTE